MKTIEPETRPKNDASWVSTNWRGDLFVSIVTTFRKEFVEAKV
jgi:hypothetical protein